MKALLPNLVWTSGTGTVDTEGKKRNLSSDCEQKVLYVRERDDQIELCVISSSQHLKLFFFRLLFKFFQFIYCVVFLLSAL